MKILFKCQLLSHAYSSSLSSKFWIQIFEASLDWVENLSTQYQHSRDSTDDIRLYSGWVSLFRSLDGHLWQCSQNSQREFAKLFDLKLRDPRPSWSPSTKLHKTPTHWDSQHYRNLGASVMQGQKKMWLRYRMVDGSGYRRMLETWVASTTATIQAFQRRPPLL